MKCKYCFAEIEEDVTVCPECGKELKKMAAEEAAAAETAEEETQPEETAEEAAPAEGRKKRKTGKIILAVTGLVVLALVLTGVVLHFMGKLDDVGRAVGIGVKNDIYRKTSYTADNKVLEAKTDMEVARVGDVVLTNGELQAHYWMSVYNFVDYYSYYLSYMGFDTSKHLDEQIYDEATGMTYQQWFLESALESWQQYATLVQMSKEAGFTLSAEQQSQLDTLPDTVKEMATEAGYTDLEAFIDAEFYPGCSMENYLSYNAVSWQAICYFDELYENLLPSQDEIEAYYTAHEEEFKTNKTSKEDGNYYDVRHILVAIEGETDENGEYSEADWEACRAKAQKMLDDFLAGEATESAFSTLAIANSADPGSASNGGLYSNLTKDYGFIEDFENWYVDESRQVGDTGLVKNTQSSTQGYHIMYFSGSKPIWEYEAKNAAISEKLDVLLEEAEAKWPMEVNYKKIILGQVEETAE